MILYSDYWVEEEFFEEEIKKIENKDKELIKEDDTPMKNSSFEDTFGRLPPFNLIPSTYVKELPDYNFYLSHHTDQRTILLLISILDVCL
jgi:hypothetical protein